MSRLAGMTAAAVAAGILVPGPALAAVPVARTDAFVTATDDVLTVRAPGVLANDTDADADALTAEVVTQPTLGAVVLAADGGFTYTPNAGASGVDSFTYRAVGGGQNSGTVAASIVLGHDLLYAVQGSPEQLIAVSTSAPGTLLASATITGLSGGETVRGIDFRAATGQLLALGSTSRLYNLNWSTGVATAIGPVLSVLLNGTDFGIDVNPVVDRLRVVSDTDQNLRINPNTGALAANDSLIAYATGDPNQGQNAVVTGIAHDNNVGGATTSALFAIDVQQGLLASMLNPNGGALTTIGSFGATTQNVIGFDVARSGIRYASLGAANRPLYRFTGNTAVLVGAFPAPNTVTDITAFLPAPPTATADSYTATEDVVLQVPAATGLLANDSDSEGNTLTAAKASDPANGTVVVNPDGSFSYTPNANYVGADSFTYWATSVNGQGLAATVSLTVTSVTDGDLMWGATLDARLIRFDSATPDQIEQDIPISGLQPGEHIAGLDVHPVSGQLLGYGSARRLYRLDRATAAATQIGTGTLPPDGTGFGFDANPATSQLRLVSDLENNLRLNPIDATPTADTAIAYITGDPGAGTNPDLVGSAHDSNTNGATSTTLFGIEAARDVLVTQLPPETGGLRTVGALGFDAANTTGFDITPAGTAYASINNIASGNSLYTVNLTTGAATLVDNIGVGPRVPGLAADLNPLPTGVADDYTTAEDTPLTVPPAGVLGNDTDGNGEPLTAQLVTGPTRGTLALNPDGGFTYTPTANLSGDDTFVYRPADTGGAGTPATVTISVTAVPEAPVAVDDAATTPVGQPVSGNVLANDTDAEGDPLTAELASQPADGEVVLAADGDFTYTPDAGFSGADHFTYRARDAALASTPATVRITVGDAEPPPDDEPPPDVEGTTRLSGPDRIETAVAISQADFGVGEARSVVLARADVFADALAGTTLAVDRTAPILLTPSNSLAPATSAEIERVLPSGGTVVILGGTAAVAPGIEQTLEGGGYVVERIAGTNRFGTAVAIARQLGDPRTQVLADGGNFPDAVSGGAAAAIVGGAVLLTAGRTMAPETQEYLDDITAIERFAVGGAAAAAAPDATPLVGASRIETAIAVAEALVPNPPVVGIATAGTFPDSLAGGAHIARRGGPMLLTSATVLPDTLASYLTANAASIQTAVLYGGTAAVAAGVQSAIGDAIA